MSKKHPRAIIELPNTRKFFIPDPGYIFVDCDLKGADALVVAKEADDKELMADILSGIDLHSKNATDLFGDRFTQAKGAERYELRQGTKQGVHATNYGAAARTLALILGWSLAEAESFQRRWFARHPGIYAWQRRTDTQLATNRSISNAFGYRIHYFDRIDSLLGQALAWIPQSTVAETCFQGALQVEAAFPFVQMLLQVHDSVLFQMPLRYFPSALPDIAATLLNPIPYPVPLILPWKLSVSEKSWGDMEPWDSTKQKAA